MPTARHLKQLYAALSVVWLAYAFAKMTAIPAAERNPNPLGIVYCMLLFTAIQVVGYFLLFKLVPRITRGLRRS
jgi:hypothetical protein